MMNPGPDHERLLSEVLAEDAPAGFREALLGETLQRVRRRRRVRQARRVAALCVVAGMLTVFAWRFLLPHSGTLTGKPRSTGYELVLTQPLSAGAIVATQPLSAGHLISSQTTVAVVSTTGGGNLRLINDDELLALVAPRPAALVRFGPDAEMLVFANPEDERGFPLN
jgi:hypothetical protein